MMRLLPRAPDGCLYARDADGVYRILTALGWRALEVHVANRLEHRRAAGINEKLYAWLERRAIREQM